ncbi:MAG: type II secretion system F family protein [Candidatus Pacearchaeota archaeon]
MIDSLRKAVDNEIEILREIAIFLRRMENASASERTLLSEGLNALDEKMKSANRSIAELVNKIEIPSGEKKFSLTDNFKRVIEGKKEAQKPSKKIRIIEEGEEGEAEKENILKELSISETLLKKIKQKKEEKGEEIQEFKKARGYLKWANKFFLNSADKLIKKGYFQGLPAELKKSNMDILFESYVSMILFSVFLSFFTSLILAIFFLFFNLSFELPIIEPYSGDLFLRFLRVVWLPLIIPVVTFLILYYYPSVEKRALSNRIDEELPFAVIHMSSISGSGIEPTEIFKIIALSKEYPYLRKEIRKVLNQINIYGYDLVTALNNVAKTTPNPRLAELFAGLGTTINSGGGLPEFFKKRSESLLLNYKLNKEKAIKIAETSMDIYISVVIAAPMILMLLLVMISISGIQIGFTPYELTFMTIGGVALINIIFLGYLQTKRTLY